MSGLFSSDAQPMTPAAPTTVPSAASRSSSEVEALADKQRKKFSASGSFTKNYFTGGLGGSSVSTATQVLGGAT